MEGVIIGLHFQSSCRQIVSSVVVDMMPERLVYPTTGSDANRQSSTISLLGIALAEER